MEILVSGLVKNASMDAARAMFGTDSELRWVEPDVLERASAMEQLLAGRDLVWAYCLPWRYIALAGTEESKALDRWSSTNRNALNLKRVLGERLSIVAASGAITSEPQDAILGRLVALLMPEVDEVLSVLKASDRLRGAAEETIWTGGSREWLLPLCAMLAGGNRQVATKERQDGMEALVADLVSKQDALVAADSAHRQRFAALDAELRDTQAALEQHFLAAREANDRLVSERRARAEAEEGSQEMKKSLERARAELANVRVALATERSKSSQSLADREALIAERAARSLLEREQEILLQRVEAISAALARQQERTAALDVNVRAATDSWIPGKVKSAVRRALRPRGPQEASLQLNRIADSGWFDKAWYLKRYPDVRVAEVDPVEHYFMHGWKEGRNPGPRFDTPYYLESNPDVLASGMNPLWHFVEFGVVEGREPAAPGECAAAG